MPHRALLTILALTLADLALWHWSLGANRDVLALVSGLTLPPLFGALLWLLALNLARLLARGARRPAARLRMQTVRAVRRGGRGAARAAGLPAASAHVQQGASRVVDKSSRKIAA